MTSVRLTTCGPPVQTDRFSLCCLIENVSFAGDVYFSKRSSDVSVFEVKARISNSGWLLWSTGSIETYEASLTGENAVVRNFSITSLNSSDILQHHEGEVWKCGYNRYYRDGYNDEHVSQYTIPPTRKHFLHLKMKTKSGFSRFLS